MMEEASRRRISLAKDDGNNPWRNSDLLTIRGREESWMAVHHRLFMMQTSLVFSHIIGSAITRVNGDITHIQGRKSSGTDGSSVAVCQKVLRSGRHYAEFIVTKLGRCGIIVGIIRHDHAKKLMNHERFGDIHQQSFYLESYLLKRGDVIGMVLDFDDGGELTLYINGFCPGVQPRRGISGHYYWAVTMDQGIISHTTEDRGSCSSVRILSSSPI